MDRFVYIASHSPSGGILRCTLTQKGELKLLGKTPLDRPTYLCREGDRLYASLREGFAGQSGIAAFRILPGGEPEGEGEILPVHGNVACHIVSHGGRVYTANYLSGSVTAQPGDKVLAFGGRGADPGRQDCSHPHCVVPTPEGKYLCVCDLGTDSIVICDPDLNTVSRVATKPGSGPRHLVFSADGRFAYVTEELTSTVSVYAYEPGCLTFLQRCSAVDENFTGESYASAIRLSSDGGQLYVSNRGHDSICCWDVEEGRLTNRRFFAQGIRWPREMNVVGEWILCGNDTEGTVAVLSRRTGEIAHVFPVEHPWCILPLEDEKMPNGG